MNTISKFKITTPIRKILLENRDITSLVGDRINPVIAPKDTKGDFIVYQRDKYGREHTKMGTYQETCHVYINAISEDYDRSKELAFQIDKSLAGFHSDPEMEIKLIDSTEDYEAGKYIQVLLFEIE